MKRVERGDVAVEGGGGFTFAVRLEGGKLYRRVVFGPSGEGQQPISQIFDLPAGDVVAFEPVRPSVVMSDGRIFGWNDNNRYWIDGGSLFEEPAKEFVQKREPQEFVVHHDPNEKLYRVTIKKGSFSVGRLEDGSTGDVLTGDVVHLPLDRARELVAKGKAKFIDQPLVLKRRRKAAQPWQTARKTWKAVLKEGEDD